MADDELSAPLGQNAKKNNNSRRFTLPVRISHIVAGALGLFVLAFAVWALAVDDPLGDEPIAVVATGFDSPRPGPALPAIVSGGTGGQGPRSYDGPGTPTPKYLQIPAPAAAQPAPPDPNTKTVTIIDGSTGKRQEVPITAVVIKPKSS